jgi:hypothetical protein
MLAMPIRLLVVSFLILLGSVLSVPAAIAVWQEREIQDEDAFVSTVSDVFANEDVQEVVALRLTEIIMTRTELRATIEEGLEDREDRENVPDGVGLLAGPLERLATESVYRICLEFLQSDGFADVLETAARTIHRAVTAVISNDDPLLDEVGGQVVLNLRPVIERAIEALAGERGLEAVENLDIPEDAGMIVISEESDHPWLWRLVRWIDDFNPVIPIVAAAILILGIALAKSRRRAIIAVGGSLAVVSGLTLIALGAPLKELATSWTQTDQGHEAATQVYDILLDSFRRQHFFIVVFGLGMVVAASAVRREDREGIDEFVRARPGPLRLAGLGWQGPCSFCGLIREPARY